MFLTCSVCENKRLSQLLRQCSATCVCVCVCVVWCVCVCVRGVCVVWCVCACAWCVCGVVCVCVWVCVSDKPQTTPRKGFTGKGKNITTKHDEVTCGRKNAARMDNVRPHACLLMCSQVLKTFIFIFLVYLVPESVLRRNVHMNLKLVSYHSQIIIHYNRK